MKRGLQQRHTLFVLAPSMRTAVEWATSRGLHADKYRYAVNAEVLDRTGPRDQYVVLDGFETHQHRDAILEAVKNKNLPELSITEPEVL